MNKFEIECWLSLCVSAQNIFKLYEPPDDPRDEQNSEMHLFKLNNLRIKRMIFIREKIKF